MKKIKKYIYIITNKINNKSYIGQTKNYKRRFHEHKKMKDMIKGKNINLLHRAINKYGVENFSFDILEYCEDYNEKEKYYIKFYDSIKNGYNIAEGGENPPINCGEDSNLSTHTQEEIDKIINDLKNTNKSFKDIAEEYHYDNIGTISRINCGNMWRSDKEEYPLRRIYLSDNLISEIIHRLKNTKDSQRQIANDYGISRSTVTMINIGQNNRRDDLEYPLRNKN